MKKIIVLLISILMICTMCFGCDACIVGEEPSGDGGTQTQQPADGNTDGGDGNQKPNIQDGVENVSDKKKIDGLAPIFDEGMSFYNTEPSVMVDGDVKYLYYSRNSEAKGGKSSIVVRKAGFDGTKWVYGERKTVLEAGASGSFDSAGVSDADVVKGAFKYDGSNYEYLMAYQGFNNNNEKDNKISLAVSNDPLSGWIKVSQFVLSSEYTNGYGLSQPSLVNYDKASKVILFYSYDQVDYTGEALIEIDASVDLKNAKTGVENTLSTRGMVEGNKYVTFHDADFAYDASTGYLYVVRNYNPANPNGVQLQMAVQVNKIKLSELLTDTATWTEVKRKVDWKMLLDPNDTDSMGWSYVYSGSIEADMYGQVSNPSALDLALTVTSYDEDTYEYLYYQTIVEVRLALS